MNNADTFRNILPWPWRVFEELEPLSARLVRTKGGEVLVQVCSTQYLGLPWINGASAAIMRAVGSAPVSFWSSLGSNYLGGTHAERLSFEARVASICQREGALGFVSGWAANYAVGEAIARMFDLVLSDRRSHNSVIHGLRAGNATVEVLDLNSSDEVVRVVEGRRDARIALIAPSLEGITGEAVRLSLAPVRDSVFVIRDECHSFGAIGETGFQEFDELMPEVRIVGFSKAFGTMGAAVCGSQEFLEALAQVASPWIFSTAVPPIIWRVNGSLIDVVASLTDERRTICELARRFRANATAGGLAHHGDLHITGLDIPPSLDANTVEAEFRRAGFFLKVSQYPSRPKESPCARVVFSPVHEGKDGDRLAEVATDLLTHRL